MAISTLTLAILLHRNKLVSLAGLEYGELARALLAALIAFAGTAWTVTLTTRLLHLQRGHRADFITIATGTTAWAILATATLLATRSTLPRQLLRRKT
jgi:putative peptidoglycan lipid II flippase